MDPLIIARIRARMEELSMLRDKDLADAAGVHPTMVQKWLSGRARDPSVSTALGIARALGWSVEFLMTGSGPAPGDVEAASLEELLLRAERAVHAARVRARESRG
jgi:transcriptional regulator with XRE-family HTH domain